MGAGVVPSFKPRVPKAMYDSDGKVLAAEFPLLDALAAKADVAPISSFSDRRPVPEGSDARPPAQWNEWFSTAEGLRTTRALIRQIEAAPEEIGASDPLYLLDELRELEKCLVMASDAGAKFRLERE